MIFTKVDFPAPFSPNKAWISPLEIEKFTLSLALKAPNVFVIFSPDNNNIEATFLTAKQIGTGSSKFVQSSLNFKEQ